jgi:hypothetical protein
VPLVELAEQTSFQNEAIKIHNQVVLNGFFGRMTVNCSPRCCPSRQSAGAGSYYSQLLRIEQLLGKNAVYAGTSALPRKW